MRFTLILFVLIIIASGCTNTLDVDIERRKPMICVNSEFNADSTWNVSVTRTRNILDDLSTTDFDPVPDAVVTLTDNQGNIIERLDWSPGVSGQYASAYRGTTKPQAGQNYRLRVEVPGEEVVDAESYVPVTIPIDEVQVDSTAFGTDEVKVSVVLTDPGGQPNYYAVKILRSTYYVLNDDTVRFLEDVRFDPIDPAFQDYFSTDVSSIFNDRLFDGKSFRFEGKVRSSVGTGTKPEHHVMLLTLSGEYYEYLTTKNLQNDRNDDPFAQPVQVFSNINNGVGIFAGFSMFVVTLP